MGVSRFFDTYRYTLPSPNMEPTKGSLLNGLPRPASQVPRSWVGWCSFWGCFSRKTIYNTLNLETSLKTGRLAAWQDSEMRLPPTKMASSTNRRLEDYSVCAKGSMHFHASTLIHPTRIAVKPQMVCQRFRHSPPKKAGSTRLAVAAFKNA